MKRPKAPDLKIGMPGREETTKSGEFLGRAGVTRCTRSTKFYTQETLYRVITKNSLISNIPGPLLHDNIAAEAKCLISQKFKQIISSTRYQKMDHTIINNVHVQSNHISNNAYVSLHYE